MKLSEYIEWLQTIKDEYEIDMEVKVRYNKVHYDSVDSYTENVTKEATYIESTETDMYVVIDTFKLE
jgi:hypothetical protein